MPARLYIVYGSHPCATAQKALELKGIEYKNVELPASGHPVFMRAMFGGRTVPGIKFEDGQKVQGSREILRELERRVPDPPLYHGPDVEEAERWGEEVFQPIGRRLIWPVLGRSPKSMYDFQQGQQMPKLPMPVIRAMAPVVVRIEKRLNDATDEALRADLQALPGHLDKIDGWIADGLLGGDRPNAADLQIAPTIRLIHTMEDVRPLIAGRPAEAFTFKWFDRLPQSVPAGVLPAEWIPDRPLAVS